MSRRKTIMPVKGYYTRAKVFVALMVAVILFYLAQQLFEF